jgi:hypothetical protein
MPLQRESFTSIVWGIGTQAHTLALPKHTNAKLYLWKRHLWKRLFLGSYFFKVDWLKDAKKRGNKMTIGYSRSLEYSSALGYCTCWADCRISGVTSCNCQRASRCNKNAMLHHFSARHSGEHYTATTVLCTCPSVLGPKFYILAFKLKISTLWLYVLLMKYCW